MKKFGIVANGSKEGVLKFANEMSSYIRDAGGECFIENNMDKETGEYKTIDSESIPKGTECVITIGGDGTLLHTAKDLIDCDIVMIGVNKGNLGFLAEISPSNMKEAARRLVDGDFHVESRMMLKGKVIRRDKEVCCGDVLNDIVIHRGYSMEMADFLVHVNGTLLGKYSADGIVLSTPTGSSAYNLSAGGPVARPDSKMILVTPICPHTIATRSIILSGHDTVEVEMQSCRSASDEGRNIAFDGGNIFELKTGDRVVVNEAEETTKIAKLDEGSFLQVIKDKLGE